MLVMIPKRFPKARSPFERKENENGDYVVYDEVTDEFEWVFDQAKEVEAIEKLHGTNCAIEIDRHKHGGFYVSDVATRMGSREMNGLEVFGPNKNHHYIARGVQNMIQRGYHEHLIQEYVEDGGRWFFGELIGPKFHGNPHEMDEHLFVPFDWLRDKCEYRSYGKYDTSFEAIRDWFRGEENGLFSLFASRMHGRDLESSLPDNGTFVEGLIFVHPEHDAPIRTFDLETDEDNFACTKIAKLRRDMFEGFQNDDWSMTQYGH